MKVLTKFIVLIAIAGLLFGLSSCGGNGSSTGGALTTSAADRVFVPPGQHDEFYAFISGGFSGQLAVHGLPSGRLFKIIPVFSVDGEKAWGFN